MRNSLVKCSFLRLLGEALELRQGLTCLENLVLLSGFLQLRLEQPQLPLQLRFLLPQAGIVTHRLQSLPQELILLIQQRNLLPRRLQLDLEDGRGRMKQDDSLRSARALNQYYPNINLTSSVGLENCVSGSVKREDS